MNAKPSCPECGVELPSDAPQGLCPKCLGQAAVESEQAAQRTTSPAETMAIGLSAAVGERPKISYFGDYELVQEIVPY